MRPRPSPGRRDVVAGLAAMLAGASSPGPARASLARPRIGFSADDLRTACCARASACFAAVAGSLGATVEVQSADGSVQRQILQIERLISHGMDLLVIMPCDGRVLGALVARARRVGVKVISYDRLIPDADVDAYISFDKVRIGQMQAQGVLDAAAAGKYHLLGGAPADYDAKLIREGQMTVLQPAIDRGDIEIIGARWVPGWSAAEARCTIARALADSRNDIQAVVCSSDALARGAIEALAAQGLAGSVAVSGQDAALSAIRRIVAGTQTVDVYKPVRLMASDAASLAVQLASGDTPTFNARVNNGAANVPAELLTPIAITRANVDRLIGDGVYTRAQLHGR